MQAAALEKPLASDAIDLERLREIMLVRIAAAPRGLADADLVGDLAPLVANHLTLLEWRSVVENEIGSRIKAGLVHVSSGRIHASEPGIAHAAAFLKIKGRLRWGWEEARDIRLIARALGLQREPAKRLKPLATLDGLRAAIVQHAFNLKIKGVATPARLRSALAAVALQRAFGNQIKSDLAGQSGFSPKAGRLLAGQLAKKPRNFGTDGRLIAALAAEHVGARQSDLAALRLAVLRHYLGAPAALEPRRRPAPASAPVARPRLVEPAAAPPLITGRPDLAGFAQEVRRHAAGKAQGWPGNRKAYISHVWQTIREGRPDWGLSAIEFKCMLTEAHRAGALALANADLKDNSSIRDLQESAVVYKNAVFHFIRVDG